MKHHTVAWDPTLDRPHQERAEKEVKRLNAILDQLEEGEQPLPVEMLVSHDARRRNSEKGR